MSGTLNKVMLIGHLGDNVKTHYFEGGDCIARFPLATNETYISKRTNKRITNTDWHTVVVKNKAAEICEKHLSKGDKVYVEGRLKNKQWQGEDGNTRYSTEVHVHDFTFLSTKREHMANARENSMDKPQQAALQDIIASPAVKTGVQQDDDLPF